ncbi:hypothetical protein APHAL10511_008442 [Amanita phalloides]|nr:hypothetical protein APHAL10511_008442 [Amanita phalloides]
MSGNRAFKFWSLINGKEIPFSAEADLEWDVDNLIKAIQQQAGVLRDCDIMDIVLWKLNESIPVAHEDTLLERLPRSITDSSVKLECTQKVSDAFPGPLEGHLHIIVTLRAQLILYNRRPSINDHWCLRFTTVRHLFNILQRHRLVQVRGTPGSGKTTLKDLLHDYILQQNFHASVESIESWATHPGEDIYTIVTRVDPAYPSPLVPTYLLFDEAQDTYHDVNLWNNFFKRVHDGAFNNYYIVLFCSYGSPSPQPVMYDRGGTPLALNPAARVSLWHAANPVGLLLSQTEFEEVAAKYKPSLKLHPGLLDYLFHLTAGHVGAVVSLLAIVAYQVRSSESTTLSLLTVFFRSAQKGARELNSHLMTSMKRTQFTLSYE